MSTVYAVVTYDLKKIANSHEKFKEALKALHWKFKYGDNDLPNTTCYVTFNPGATEKTAKDFVKKQLKEVSDKLKTEITGFTLERYYVITFKKPEAEVDFWTE